MYAQWIQHHKQSTNILLCFEFFTIEFLEVLFLTSVGDRNMRIRNHSELLGGFGFFLSVRMKRKHITLENTAVFFLPHIVVWQTTRKKYL